MSLADAIRHCPRCGSGDPERKGPGHFACPACGFVFYLNAAAAVVVFLEDGQGRVLFIRRAVEPQKGKLVMPGGFIDAGERAEDALVREVREEVGLELLSMEYLASFPNRYEFKGVVYDTLDLFYAGKAGLLEAAQALDEVERVEFLRPEEVDPGEIAFVSQRNGLKAYLQSRKQKSLPG